MDKTKGSSHEQALASISEEVKAMGFSDRHFTNLVNLLAKAILIKLEPELKEERVWLPIPQYCKKHGLSQTTVYRAIDNGEITEENGGLASGCGQKGKHKRIHYRFDIERQRRLL